MATLGPKISYATTTLSYPIFAAEFDPYNRGYLVVGGGGGESRSGVPNQISILDVSNRAAITPITEIELSRDEDSVQSLGSLATKDGLIVLAGINSSQEAQNANKNEHFRAFDVKLPPRKKQKTGTTEVEKGLATCIGKRSLFKPEKAIKKEAYQRVLKLSPAQRKEAGSKRIGAIVSGMTKPSEIIVFDATTALPTQSDILARIESGQNDEIQDLDIAVADTDRFSLAWCTDFEIYEQTLEYNFNTKKVQKTPKGPRRIHQVPTPIGAAVRPKFRSVRFLDAENVLALVNRPGKKGVELHIYHLYPTGPASTILQLTLPSHVKQAVSLDVCILDADKNGDRQIGVAVAGQDVSIETYVLNYKGATNTFSQFISYQSFRDVHKHQMTKVCFSPFHAPAKPGDKETPEQFIRLASVSYGNSVVVDSLPLNILQTKGQNPRHVLLHPRTQQQQRWIMILMVSFMVLISAWLGRSYLQGEADIRADLQQFWSDTYQEIFNQSTPTIEAISKEMKASAASIIDNVVPFSSVASFVESSVSTPDVASLVESVVPTNMASLVESAVPTSVASIVDNAMSTASMASIVDDLVPSGSISSFAESAIPSSIHKLQDMLNLHPEESKAVVVQDVNEELAFNMHPSKDEYLVNNPDTKHWDELPQDQQHYWRKRLVQAGRWAESEGETVLKSVLWSQYAGFVGAAAGEILREL